LSMLSFNNAVYHGQSRLSEDRSKTSLFFILGDMHYLSFVRQAQQSSIVYRSTATYSWRRLQLPPAGLYAISRTLISFMFVLILTL
jgi:hypothetical protein